ncbi:CaiB/BaiF CoA-transferase family protein [Pararhodobacter sp. SW119]|uniref:CaiB/BaiF CoA transferase family protein n=1 Tax=Pararhodobacter sp. SW119 TaxID=2780075 RepID=UPI001ADF080B|nr:CaiB/BaiF CoA-transferase family protein [Pararhodobacter sp. SW119]
MLDGLRIIEFEGLGPGPFAAMWLADQGAEVICIQRPGGAGTPGVPDRSILNRGKKTIALDLKAPADRPLIDALLSSADALVEGFRPGVMERLGLGPEQIHRVNPRLVYGRMTGWGQDGPRAAQAGHDLNYIAASGALWYAGLPGQPPVTPATLVGDIGGGAMYLVAGLLAGLLRAQRTGEGSVVDAAIVDGSAHMLALLMSMAPTGMLTEARGQSLLDGPHWSRSYACADGGFLSVQCLEAKFYAEFLARLGLTDDPDFARQYDPAGWPRATERLATIFAAQPRDHWAALFAGSDACVAPVLSPWEAAHDPHIVARAGWIERDGTLEPAPAPRFASAAPAPGPVPTRDAHRAEVLADLRQRGLLPG